MYMYPPPTHYRRTPLHITCGKMELVECSIALLEYGAQIMATDVLGLRPCDVNPVSHTPQLAAHVVVCLLTVMVYIRIM